MLLQLEQFDRPARSTASRSLVDLTIDLRPEPRVDETKRPSLVPQPFPVRSPQLRPELAPSPQNGLVVCLALSAHQSITEAAHDGHQHADRQGTKRKRLPPLPRRLPLERHPARLEQLSHGRCIAEV